jgi:2-dehydro-3-deoxygalactonokinase
VERTKKTLAKWPVIGVDWGSTNRRAYLVGENGAVLEQREDGLGVFGGGGDFASSLRGLIGDWRDTHGARVFLSGMIGSRNGWQEVQYLETPISLDRLAQFCVPLNADGEVHIVPGVCQRAPSDVMRGEETQLFGAFKLAGSEGWHILPGTHSKWILLLSGKIHKFQSFLTGEMYALLRKNGALAAVANQPADDDVAFVEAVCEANERGAFQTLFSVRAGVLLNAFPSHQASSRLSGLLIGAEWAAAQALGVSKDIPIHIIAAAPLAARYSLAASTLGFRVVRHDPDASYVRAIEELANYA